VGHSESTLGVLPAPEPATVLAAVIAPDPLASRLVAALTQGGIEVPEGSRHSSVGGFHEAGEDSAATDVAVLACDLSLAREMPALRSLTSGQAAPRVVVVTPAGRDMAVREALNNGADGVLFAGEIETALAAVTWAVGTGHVCVPRELRRTVARPAFSHRERQVLARVVRGLQNHEIASELFLAESTVKSHLASSFHKLGVRSRKEAAAMVLDPAEGLRALILDETVHP
jgi:DNA-binding NarL/FixJ family response regulator